ncbi:MAG TPA: hypothetical protein O0X39_01135 [Methanocorpusculum sp.]|nr:hypothetical protein [Methanocorpusculum sp.]
MMIVKASDEPYTTVVVKIPREDILAFDAVATARRTSRAALIRECILDKVEEWNNKTTTKEVTA